MTLHKPLPCIQEYLHHSDPDYVRNQFLFLVNEASSKVFKADGGSANPLPFKWPCVYICTYTHTPKSENNIEL